MADFLSIDFSNFAAFLMVAMVMMIIPGPDMAFIISRSVSGGRKQGIATAFGMQLGFIFHILIAVCGLSAILMTSTIAFQIVKYVGAVYLVYLGVKTIHEKQQITLDTQQKIHSSVWKSFTQGAITNILNPKNALFFLTFFPQFIKPAAGNTAFQFIFLGVVFGVMGLIFDILLTLLATALKDRFTTNTKAIQWQKNISGGVLIILGAILAFEKSRA